MAHYAWVHLPPPEEEAEAAEQLRAMGLANGPEFLSETTDYKTSLTRSENWLRKGVMPIQ